MKSKYTNSSMAVIILLVISGSLLLLWPGQANSMPQLSGPAYTDLSEGSYYHEAVTSLKEQGVFEGTDCKEGFCPEDPLERWQMAIWLIRVLDDQEPEPVSQSRFVDVDAQESWAPFVERLADLEVTTGCNQQPPKYCPQGSVRRNQMATFLYRAFDLPDAKEPAGFIDVSKDSWAYKPVNALLATGITTGCNKAPLRYCPDNLVTKAQAATFLHRALEWRDEQVSGNDDPWGSDRIVVEGIFHTEENDFSRGVKIKLIDVYADEYQWLAKARSYTNYADSITCNLTKLRDSLGTVHYYLLPAQGGGVGFNRLEAYRFVVDPSAIGGFNFGLILHELAYVCILSHDVTRNQAPLAAGHLYFDQLAGADGSCLSTSLYAGTAEFLDRGGQPAASHAWQICSHLPAKPTSEALTVIRQAFTGKMPEWFEATYKSSGAWDCQRLRSDIKAVDMEAIGPILRDAFSGYCPN